MQPPLAARLPLEMLHGIRDEYVAANESGSLDGLIKQPSRGSDEGVTAQVFFVAWLFADQHEFGSVAPFAGYGLCGVLPQIAAMAILRALAGRRWIVGRLLGHHTASNFFRRACARRTQLDIGVIEQPSAVIAARNRTPGRAMRRQ